MNGIRGHLRGVRVVKGLVKFFNAMDHGFQSHEVSRTLALSSNASTRLTAACLDGRVCNCNRVHQAVSSRQLKNCDAQVTNLDGRVCHGNGVH